MQKIGKGIYKQPIAPKIDKLPLILFTIIGSQKFFNPPRTQEWMFYESMTHEPKRLTVNTAIIY